jgi:hypothetical protein
MFAIESTRKEVTEWKVRNPNLIFQSLDIACDECAAIAGIADIEGFRIRVIDLDTGKVY